MNLYDEKKDRISIHNMIIAKVAELSGEEVSYVERIVFQEQLAIKEMLEEGVDSTLTHFGSFVLKGKRYRPDKLEKRAAFLKKKNKVT